MKGRPDIERAIKTLRKVHRMTCILGYGGAVFLALGLLMMRSGAEKSVWLPITALAAIAAFGALGYAGLRLNCYRCGKTLMYGGRLHMDFPAYCSHCGAPLNENKESE